jgi:putative oxidoreductase
MKRTQGLQPLKDERMSNIVNAVTRAYIGFVAFLNHLRSPLLLAIRLYWGWQFMQDGWGKLTHLDKVTGFFTSLNLPAPHMTALMVALVELCGGFLFTFGIASRLTSLVLFFNMTMAYLSVPDDRVNFSHIFSKPDDFYGATPYTYWFAALLILILGPGRLAVDTLLRRMFATESEHAHTAV